MIDHSDKTSRTENAQRSYAKWPDAVLIIILALLPGLFFWRLIAPNPVDRLPITTGDFTEQYFPLRAFAAGQWVQGQIPLWNPYLYGGQPALADIQSGALYPPHVIEALILGWGGPLLLGQEIGFPLWALEWQVMAHFSLAAVGAYLFVRHLGLQSAIPLRRARFGGGIASLVFTYSGYLTGFPVQQMTILAVSAWLPWVMWAVSVANHRASQSAKLISSVVRSFSPIAWGALALAMAILAGHPQTVLYIFYLTLLYTAFWAVYVWRSDVVTPPEQQGEAGQPIAQVGSAKKLSVSLGHLFRRSAIHLIVWLLIVLLGVALAAAQLLPTVEFIRHSLRADLSYQAVSAGLPLNELISIIYPGFLGGSPEYVGIVTLVLIGLALILGQPRRDVFFWAGAGLLSLVLAFGGNTFLYALFYLLVPGFDAVRQQERAFLVYSFSAAVLAGYGAMTVVGPLTKLARQRYVYFERYFGIIIGVAFGLTAFFIYGSAMSTARGDDVNLFFGVLWHHLFGLIMLGGMLVWLALRRRRWLRRTWGMALLGLWLVFNLFTVNWQFNLEQRDTELFGPNGVVQYLRAKLPDSEALAEGRIVSGGLLPGGNSAASVHDLQDLTGNTPLQLATVDTFLQWMPAWRMWQLMNVRYVVDKRDITGDGLRLVFAEGELNVFEVGDPFPRVWLVERTEVIPDNGRAIARLADDMFDLRQQAILSDSADVSFSRPLDSDASEAKVVDLRPNHLTAAVRATGMQLLVLSQIYYPGWQAEIDGQPTDVWRVNVVQQGVIVPPGQHTVELRFRPSSFWWGGLISIVGGVVWLLILIVSRFKKPR